MDAARPASPYRGRVAPSWTSPGARLREVGDAFLAIPLAAAGLVEVGSGLSLSGIGTAAPGPWPVEVALTVVQTLPLLLRRTRPLLVAAVVCGALVLQLLVVAREVSLVAGLLPLLVVVYSGAAHAARGWRAAPMLGGLLVQGLLSWRVPEEGSTNEVLFGLFVIVGSFLVGDTVRSRQRSADEKAERLAEQLASEQAGRDAWAAEALAQERVAIARELHDVIAHGVSVMGVQAAAAGLLVDRDPAAARTALAAIENQARESVGELQRLLGVLRESEDPSGLEPQPGLLQLDSLLEQLRRAGLPASLDVRGPRVSLPAGIDLTAYRVVQEALTNVLKHAGTVPVSVCIHYEPAVLTIDVHDQGPPLAAPPRPGHGLIGMRERVSLYGGTLQVQAAGPRGLLVRARLPLPQAS